MKTYFVDTNVFVHTLFTVDESAHRDCVRLFTSVAQEKISLWTTSWVLAELIWFLIKQKVGRKEIRRLILTVITSKGLEVSDRELILTALDEWGERLDFTDALNLVVARRKGINLMISFDKDFDANDQIERFEPAHILKIS